MTAELNEAGENTTKDEGERRRNTEPEVAPQNLPTEILEIFDYLSRSQSIVFKSQQIDDPEMERTEKVQIVRDIYARNRQTFLMRFGAHLEEHHLQTFARLALSDGAVALRPNEHCEEMQFMLKDYERKLRTRKQDVKNRRYAALQQLKLKGEYFSEQEMMKRSPILYHELIGQYLSEAEKKQRDGYDVRNTTFSQILMHSLEKQQLDDLMKEAQASSEVSLALDSIADNKMVQTTAEEPSLCASNELDNDDDDDDDEVPVNFRQQWGNFDNELISCSISKTNKNIKQTSKLEIKAKSSPKISAASEFITAGERNLLRQEFMGIMQEQFLSGQDKDFDYTQVDDNSTLDDLRQLDQDKEDAYFEESENDDTEAEMQHIRANDDNEESADELDIFMSHLSKHHSLLN